MALGMPKGWSAWAGDDRDPPAVEAGSGICQEDTAGSTADSAGSDLALARASAGSVSGCSSASGSPCGSDSDAEDGTAWAQCELLEALADRLEAQQQRYAHRRRGSGRGAPTAPAPGGVAAPWRWREATTSIARADLQSSLAEACDASRRVVEQFSRASSSSAGEDGNRPARIAEAEGALKAVRDRLAAAIVAGHEVGLEEDEMQRAIAQRRKLHSAIQDMRGRIRVYCRVRPMSARERRRGEREVVSVCNGNLVEVQGQSAGPFAFDAVFNPGKQDEVFQEAQDLVQSVLDGQNVTVLCYGQTGAGKTHTMYGTDSEAGLAVQMVGKLFETADRRRITVTGSLVEMHNGRVFDLLSGHDASPQMRSSLSLKWRDGDADGVQLEGVIKRPLTSAAALEELVAEGLSRRVVRAHAMNSDSSRSHALLTIYVSSAIDGSPYDSAAVDAKITFVDLAGSERLKRTETSCERTREAIEINRSLSALGDVVESIVQRRRHIPYRNHKLTQLLQDSLGGSAKVLVFVNCSPASASAQETTAALKFASRAQRVTNSPGTRIAQGAR